MAQTILISLPEFENSIFLLLFEGSEEIIVHVHRMSKSKGTNHSPTLLSQNRGLMPKQDLLSTDQLTITSEFVITAFAAWTYGPILSGIDF